MGGKGNMSKMDLVFVTVCNMASLICMWILTYDYEILSETLARSLPTTAMIFLALSLGQLLRTLIRKK